MLAGSTGLFPDSPASGNLTRLGVAVMGNGGVGPQPLSSGGGVPPSGVTSRRVSSASGWGPGAGNSKLLSSPPSRDRSPPLALRFDTSRSGDRPALLLREC